MKAWVRHDHLDRPVTTCRFCREPIVLVEDVGWIVDERSGSYDMCEVNPLGNHNPDDNWRSTGGQLAGRPESGRLGSNGPGRSDLRPWQEA